MENVNRITHDYTEIVYRLPKSLKLAYGTGHILNDICASMWFTYLLVFFHYILGFKPELAGAVLLIGQVADAIATPFVGYFSDQNDDLCLCKYGKRKIWHLLGTICVLFSFRFIFSHCIQCENAHQWAQLVYYAAFVVIFQFGWAAVQISHLSLVPELTPTDHERTELIAIRYSFTVLSNILVYCIMWATLHITDESSNARICPKDEYKFQMVVWIGLGIGAVTSLIFHIFVKETNTNNSNRPSQGNIKSISTLLKDFELYKLACVYMPTRLFVNLSQIYVPLYLHEYLKMSAVSLAIVPLTMFVSSFVMSLIIEKLNTKLGRKVAYALGVFFGLCACTWIWFGKGDSYKKFEIYPVSLLLGCAGSIMLVTSLGCCADFIGRDVGTGATVYGIMSFTDKLSNGLVVMLIQYFRNVANSSHYFKDILVFSCGGSAILGAIMILYFKPSSRDEDYQSIYPEETAEEFDRSISPVFSNILPSNSISSTENEVA
ncbi:major facilitator superfamily domain-containing protein 12-like [Prorops nasuta]|uniref:major facilitator superfamily domain-containing protein 12-like n=1 Tax=Prorops nasuta TaxID=863751 RepID=UPI0034CE3F60